MSLEENRGSFNFRPFGPPLASIQAGTELPETQYPSLYQKTIHSPYTLAPSIFRPPKATKATRKVVETKNLKRRGNAAMMNVMENTTGRTRRPSRKLIEAAETAAAVTAAKAAKAQERAVRAAAAQQRVAQEVEYGLLPRQNPFAQMLRQSEVEGHKFSMGSPINLRTLPRRRNLPRRRGGKRRTVRRRR